MFFRQKPSGPYRYLQIVENHREGGKVRQRTLTTVGRLDLLQASGQLDALMRSGLRFCEKLAVIDAVEKSPGAGVATLRIGPDLVFGRLWERLGIQTELQGLLEEQDLATPQPPHLLPFIFQLPWFRLQHAGTERQ